MPSSAAMSRSVATLPNIGPTTARWLTAVGLGDEDALREALQAELLE